MNLLSRLIPGFLRQTHPHAPVEKLVLNPISTSGLEDLNERLDRWGHLWSADKEVTDNIDAQQLVTERLTCWMEQCFGQHMPDSLHSKGDPISLASSLPVLTAFLGRRATRELSRRVLKDI
jgi:hypothetical protein